MTGRLNKPAKIFPFYILFAIPSVVVGMLIWTVFVDEKLYYCSDSMPVFDFIPPFVHGSQYGDYWIAAPALVWSIWFLLILLMFIIPYFLARRVKLSNNS